MKLFNCMFQKKIKRAVSLLSAFSVLFTALFIGVASEMFSVKAESDPYVLKIEANSTGMPFFGQWVSLKVGKTYIYSNCFLPETEPNQCIYKNTSDGQITNYEIISDSSWWKQGLKFTVPSDAMDDPNTEGNKLIWVGFRGYKVDKPLYYYDFKLCDADSPETNLLKDSTLLENDTNLNKNVWISPYNTEIKNTLSKVKAQEMGGINIFKKDDTKVSYALKLAPNSGGMPWFGQWVTLEKGKTYIFSNCHLPDTDVYHRICYKHTNNDYDTSDLSGVMVYDTAWSRYGTEFTIPATAPDDGNGKTSVWVGMRGYKTDKTLYYYDFKLYDKENPSVNILKDADLTAGGASIKADVWKSPGGSNISSVYSKVTLESIGGEDIFKSSATTEPMVLKLDANTTGMPFFGQWVTLEKGKTYILSNCYLPGTNVYHMIYYKHTNNDYDKSDLTGEPIFDTAWSRYGTEFTIPATAPDDGNGKTSVWVGMRGYKADKSLYYYDFKLYDTNNPDVNIFKDAGLLENGSSINKSVWKSPTGDIKSSYSKVTLASIGGEDTFKGSLTTEPMVLKLEPDSTGMPFFGQWVTLEKGKTYIVSNCYLSGTDVYHRIYYKHDDNDYDKSDLTGETIYDTILSRYGTKFTVPATAPDDGNGKTLIWVGIRGYKTDKPLYYYDFKLYDTNNPDVNIFKDADLLIDGSVINKVVWQTPAGEIKTVYSKVTLESIGGEDVFELVQPEGSVALKLEPNTTGMPFFGQNVSLKNGKTYIFSNCYLPYTEPNQMVCKAGTEVKIDCETIEDEEWSRQSIKFTVPNDAEDDPNIAGNKLLWVGFRGNKSDKPLYYYDLKLYDVENPNINLLKDNNLKENGWHFNKSVWISPYGDINASYSKVELEAIGGIDIFKKPMSNEPMVLSLAPETTGMPFFGQWIDLEKGKTYVFSICYLPGTDAIQNVYLDSSGTELFDYDVTYDKEWSKRNMKFTVPLDANDDESGKAHVWVGIRGYSYSSYLYYYNFELYEENDTEVNLMKDYDLRQNDLKINTSLWKSPYNTEIKDEYSKITLESAGGEDIFKRTGDVGPKMVYYTRTNRGPNHETFACFTFSIPEELRVAGQNYVLQFDARSVKGVGLSNFRCGAIVPELALDKDNTVAPASIDGYTYTFNLRFTDNTEKKLSFMIFIPEDAEGYLSNLYIYAADKDFKKVSNRDLFKNAYGDFSRFQVGDYLDLYAKQGGCIGTETGLLKSVPEYFFEIQPNVPVPLGDKMISYASVWGAGTIAISLPYTVEKGAIGGKNYIVSLTIRPTKGRDPAKFYSTGIKGEHVQVYPVNVDGYKYTFNLTEHYNFSLVLEYPIDCEGYISNLEMIEADMDFKPLNNINRSTAFGKNGRFTDTAFQQGMKWDGIAFNGGFVNTFIDTRALEKELKIGKLGNYSSTGGIWPIPTNFFVAEKDEGWADDYISDAIVGKGTVIGKINNSLGKPISNCTVVIKSMQNLIEPKKAFPDKNGAFRFDAVPVDGYEVSIIPNGGNEVLGDMFFWIEENKDIVRLSLVYKEGEALDVTQPQNLVNPDKPGKADIKDKIPSASPESDNTLMWILIGGGALIVLGASALIVVFIKKRNNKIS